MATTIPVNSPFGLSLRMLHGKNLAAHLSTTAENARGMLAQGKSAQDVKAFLDERKRIFGFEQYGPTVEEVYQGPELLQSLSSAYEAIERGDTKLLDFCLGSVAHYGRPYAEEKKRSDGVVSVP